MRLRLKNRLLGIGLMLLAAILVGGCGDADQVAYEAYETGDYATAMREWKPLAEQGHAGAQFFLGVMYVEGQGVPQDDAEAVKWYRLAAEQGHVAAQGALGEMYANGRGVPEDDAEAVQWTRLAAGQGHVAAQLSLGLRYYLGRGVPEDQVLAYHWWNLAAAQGDEAARKFKTRVQGEMTSAQIAEAQKLSREFKPTVK